MKIAFQLRVPPIDFDLSHGGKAKSHDWFFFSCYNTEQANTLLEVNASQRDKDFILAVNWKKLEEDAKEGMGKKEAVQYAHNVYDEDIAFSYIHDRKRSECFGCKRFKRCLLFHPLS